jgi:hypothetical protein
MTFLNQRERLTSELEHFQGELLKARTDFERERIEATIRGIEMMLSALSEKPG